MTEDDEQAKRERAERRTGTITVTIANLCLTSSEEFRAELETCLLALLEREHISYDDLGLDRITEVVNEVADRHITTIILTE